MKIRCLVAAAFVASIGVSDSGGSVRAVSSREPGARRVTTCAGRTDSGASLEHRRAMAGRADRDGRAHYALALALREAASRAPGARDEREVRSLLREGVEAAEVAWSRGPRSSAYATVLGDLHGRMASRETGLARIRHGRRASDLFARAVELDPGNPRAHVGVGISRLEAPRLFGGSVAGALVAFREAQRLDAQCAEAWVWEGVALRRQGRVRQARRALVRALEIDAGNGHAQGELDALEQDFPD